MTTYGEAFAMGIASNFEVAVTNEIACAGNAISEQALEAAVDPNVPDKVKDLLVHVLNHLSTVRELCEAYDESLDEYIKEFDEANPGQLYEVSKEISEFPLILRMQDILGISQEDRLKKIKRNLETMQADKN